VVIPGTLEQTSSTMEKSVVEFTVTLTWKQMLDNHHVMLLKCDSALQKLIMM
jgi:hypothetical protein